MESVNEIGRTASKKNITVVKLREDEGACKSVGDFSLRGTFG